ncbi:MAG: DUF4013 domain-containing protein [Anaerolineaceae bacterium]|jgi:hypothetical protein|nr:DUF4013 domain-containing protein [Anaerolineaceae bacterium]
MDFGAPFTFPFEDPDWLKKIALAGLVGLIPIVGQLFIAGWGLEVARRVIRREPVLLPDINFGEYLGLGFKQFLIGFVYGLPLFLFGLPIAIVGGIGGAADMDAETIGILVTVISCCCGGLALIYTLLLAFMMPAALGRFLDTGELSAAFKVKEVFALVKAAPVPFLIAIAGSVAAGFIASLGSIVFIIGVIFTAAYSMAIIGHFYGQAYNEAKAAL